MIMAALRDLNREILAEARQVTGNRKLRQKDVVEWVCAANADGLEHRPGEKAYYLPGLGVAISVKEA